MKKTKREHDLLGCSIERVVNTTLRVLGNERVDEEDRYTCEEDWRGLKETVVEVWDEARNDAFIQRLAESADAGDRLVAAGELRKRIELLQRRLAAIAE